jgi:diaminopropionate ammonia-lyase
VLTLSDDLWRKVRLDVRSKVLLISTEGATAPSVYRDLVGMDADEVLRRQRL